MNTDFGDIFFCFQKGDEDYGGMTFIILVHNAFIQKFENCPSYALPFMYAFYYIIFTFRGGLDIRLVGKTLCILNLATC